MAPVLRSMLLAAYFFNGAVSYLDDRDLLGRLYHDFELFGGAEIRIESSDADVHPEAAVKSLEGVPTLADARHRIFNGGRLPDSGAEPGELSIALTDDPTTVRVSWATMDKEVESPRVELDEPCTLDGCSFPASTTTYSVPKRWWPQFNGSLHSALVTGLQPSQQVSYRVGSDSPATTGRQGGGGGSGGGGGAGDTSAASAAAEGGAFSGTFSFSAAPAIGTGTKVALIGDQGTVMPLGFAVTEKLTTVQDDEEEGDGGVVDMVVHVGDLSYAGIDTAYPRLNVSKEDEFEWIWDLWQLQNQPVRHAAHTHFHFSTVLPFNLHQTKHTHTHVTHT